MLVLGGWVFLMSEVSLLPLTYMNTASYQCVTVVRLNGGRLALATEERAKISERGLWVSPPPPIHPQHPVLAPVHELDTPPFVWRSDVNAFDESDLNEFDARASSPLACPPSPTGAATRVRSNRGAQLISSGRVFMINARSQ